MEVRMDRMYYVIGKSYDPMRVGGTSGSESVMEWSLMLESESGSSDGKRLSV